MSRPLLDLVHERVAHGLAQAAESTLLSFFGAWLSVMDNQPQWKPRKGVLEYMDVVEAGMAFVVCRKDEQRKALGTGLSRLQGRRFFAPDRPPTLEGDPWALLALAVAVDALAEPQAKAWLLDILCQALRAEHDARRADLLRLGIALLEKSKKAWEAVSPLLKAAVAVRMQVELPEEAVRSAFASVMTADPVPYEWSVFHKAAIKTLFAAQPTVDLVRPTTAQIVQLLRLVPAALKRWPWEDAPKTKHAGVTAQRWEIQHEYHVQSLLWALLRPVFPDLEDEENLPSVGPKHPRADLLVPSLRLVIEAKYLREATQAARAKIIGEVAEDTGLYLVPGSPCDQIVAFVWDATASTHQHDEIIAGIHRLRGIAGVVVVSKPGEWTKPGA